MNLERIELCPGNATRYDLLFGRDDSRVFLAWLQNGGGGGPCLYLPADCAVEAGYLMEKMGLRSRADANALLAFLASRGHPAYLSPGYDSDGVFMGMDPIERGA